MNVLVAGGAGYIGSHITRKLLKAGHRTVVVDDFSRGHRELAEAASSGLATQASIVEARIGDREAMARIFRENKIEAVLHLAAFIEVAESVSNPASFYRNNVADTLGMLDAMRATEVRRLVFSSTAAVYGEPRSTPIAEDAPLAPINPYGRTKMMVELALADYARAYGLGYIALRYFNVAGASPDGVIGEAHEPESHLIPRILLAALASGKSAPSVDIYGTDYPTPDGTCVRDYVHVDDLADAHLLALERIEPGRGTAYNLGSESGFSVRQVLGACERVVGHRIRSVERPRRQGDPPVLVASSARIRAELGWERHFPELETLVRHAWDWHSRRAGK